MVKLAVALRACSRELRQQCSQELLLNAGSLFPYKKKPCNASCTCKECPSNVTGETVCQDFSLRAFC